MTVPAPPSAAPAQGSPALRERHSRAIGLRERAVRTTRVGPGDVGRDPGRGQPPRSHPPGQRTPPRHTRDTAGWGPSGTRTRPSPAPRAAARPTGTRRAPARFPLARAGAALGLWLRRPLTSLHLIIGVFGLLALFGLVMVLSASAVESYAADGSSYSVFSRQLLFCVPGLLCSTWACASRRGSCARWPRPSWSSACCRWSPC